MLRRNSFVSTQEIHINESLSPFPDNQIFLCPGQKIVIFLEEVDQFIFFTSFLSLALSDTLPIMFSGVLKSVKTSGAESKKKKITTSVNANRVVKNIYTFFSVEI